MKKILLYLLVVVSLFSCKGEDGRDGLDGLNVNLYTWKVKINASDWRLSGEPYELGSYYYATVAVPELDQDVLNNGIKLAYIETSPGVQVGLPYVLHKGDVVNGKESLWTQTYDCEYEPGYVTFILTYSDFDTWNAPDTEFFNIILSR